MTATPSESDCVMAPKSTAARGGHVHFWFDDRGILAELDDWDPDHRPELFASGLGHNLLELCVRLREAGYSVSIGPRVPRDTSLVVGFPYSGGGLREVRFSWACAGYPLAIIRSDAALSWIPLVQPDTTIVPNNSQYWRDRVKGACMSIPALPQRGLVPREPGRRGSIRLISYKGNPENVPDYLRDPAFEFELLRRGVSLQIDAPATCNGSDQSWHDFGDVDVALCVRTRSDSQELLRKPPTRLINAWCASAIPFVAPEPAYLELYQEGVDGFLVNGPADILAALDRLMEDQPLLLSVESAVARRSQEFQSGSILQNWVRFLFESDHPAVSFERLLVRRLQVVARSVVRLTLRYWRRCTLAFPKTRSRTCPTR